MLERARSSHVVLAGVKGRPKWGVEVGSGVPAWFYFLAQASPRNAPVFQ